MPLKKIAKQLLFISRMPKLCAILQLVSAPSIYICIFYVIVDDPDQVSPPAPRDHSKKVRTWGPSSVHQKERTENRTKRTKVKERFMAERSNSVPNLGIKLEQIGKDR